MICSLFVNIEQNKVFRTTEYINGSLYRHVYDTIAVNTKIDIHFFKQNFYIPYHLPKKFIDVRCRNKKVSVWRDPKGKKDHQENWENTYTYDNLGRITSYAYSSCFICSSLPYDYRVMYNTNNQVESIASKNLGDSFRFYYDYEGGLFKLEKYLFGNLETEISLVKDF